MKTKYLLILLILLPVSLLSAQSADEIRQRVKDRIDADTVSTRSQMILTAKDGTVTDRMVDQYSIDTDQGKRTMIIFQKPAGIAGTRFLTVEVSGRDDDKWIYLPSLGKTRRISSGEGSNSFMGTDFSYDDISADTREVSEDENRILREEILNGKACWVIESIPKDGNYQYSRTIAWIEKDSYMGIRGEMYDSRGALIKIMEVLTSDIIQGYPTPTSIRMSNVQTGTSTTMETSIIKYNDNIPAGVFTTRFLETGRP